MKLLSTILLALCNSDVSLSFLASSHRRRGKVNAANVESSFSISSSGAKPSKSGSLFFYSGDDYYDDSYLHYSGNDDYNYYDDSYLQVVNNVHGGDGNYYEDSNLQVVNNVRGGDGNYRNNNKGNENDTLNSLSVTELKRLLNDRGVDYRDCLEKKDLEDRLISSQGLASSSSSSFSAPGGLSNEENRVVNTFTSTSPSVAYIQTISQQQQTIRGFSLKGNEVPTGAGSGFLWDNNGHVVTNYHVIASATKSKNPVIKVKLQGMPAMQATIVGYEPEKDLAVLKIPSKNLPTPISVGSSNDLQVGQNVLAIGNPFGLDYTLTTGVVSALGRDVDGIGGRPIKGCIQSDAAINPGNSGGPLLDSRGRLIGVNMAIYSPSGASAGIGFSIPVDTVRRVVNQIIRHGRVIRPTLGVNVADDRLLQNIKMQLRKELNGVLIVEVLPGSPAEAAGLKASALQSDGSIVLGDLITHVNNEPVVSVEDLLSTIEARADGEVVTVRVWRKCDMRLASDVQVKLTSNEKLKRNTASGRKTLSSGVGSSGAWQ